MINGKPGFKDYMLYQKYRISNWKNLISMVLRHGPIYSTMNMFRYPWMLHFLKINGLLRTLLKGRSGEYRKSTALMLSAMSHENIEMIDGALIDDPDKLVYHQAMVSPEIIMAMGLNSWPYESIPFFIPMLTPSGLEKSIDECENEGVPPDACSFVKAPMGLTYLNAIPHRSPSSPMVSSANSCDGQKMGFAMIGRLLGAPSFQLDVPYHFKTERAVDYYVNELKNLITFLEEHTPGKMDWDRLKEIIEKKNKITELCVDLFDMLRNKPAPMAAEVIYLAKVFTDQLRPGTDKMVTLFQELVRMCRENLENGVGAVPNEKYRAALWNTESYHAMNLFPWAEKTYGVALLMDMMAYSDLNFIDTSSPESMLRGLASTQMAGAMARHTRGPVENYIDDLFNVYKMLDLDMIWISEHIGCKNASAAIGIVREMCREREIPLFTYSNDIFDPRLTNDEGIKAKIDHFMQTVMKAEPLTS